MIRYLIFTTLLAWNAVVFSQSPVIQGVVTYGVLPVGEGEGTQQAVLSQFGRIPSPHVKDILKKFRFELHFTEAQSGFDRVENRIRASEDDIQTARMIVGFNSYTWQDRQKAYKITQFGFGRNAQDVLLYVDKTQLNWVITDESKEIGGYICFKATLNEVLERPNRNFIKPVIAWFTPEIPVALGPLHYGNLPGLILELQTESALYGVEKIDFKTPPLISEMPDLPEFTEKELVYKLINR